MVHFGQFLLGGAVGGAFGLMALKSQTQSQNAVLLHMREIASGRAASTEISEYKGSVFGAFFDTRAWNRLVLDVHAKVIQYWPQ
mmetsp:Transcript_45918/g.109361  ORF Transcript_45918/g.109361 Transcript_45918/m.109361 type:complete len:84 (+) Transcript_45918:115-366(+)